MRSGSLSRLSSMNSRRSSLSRDGSCSQIVDDVSSDMVARIGDIGDQVVCRSSSYRNSISLSRDPGDQLRDSCLLRDMADQILGDVDDSVIAQAGDSGGRGMGEDRYEENEELSVSMCLEEGFRNVAALKLPDDAVMVSNGYTERSSSFRSPVSPLVEEIVSPLPEDSIIRSTMKDQVRDKQERLPQKLEYISNLLHLSVFGIFGVFTRYLLQKLFGPGHLAFTRDDTALYLDLPSNVLGSFFMGWFGIVMKGDLRNISEQITIGLTTGYMGSLTTFSGWNQKMLELSSKGEWASAVGGYVIGMFIVDQSIAYGVMSADGIRKLLAPWLIERSQKSRYDLSSWSLNTSRRQTLAMIAMFLMLASLWALSGSLARRKLDNETNGAVLWLGCLLGPFGVWSRWHLARLNGQGWGSCQWFKWLPTGTLLANVLAACIMAALSIMSKVVERKIVRIIMSGIQFGFLGCLSTVSTFVAEVYAMRQSVHPGRAFTYILLTICPSFVLGTLIYSLPVWMKHYT